MQGRSADWLRGFLLPYWVLLGEAEPAPVASYALASLLWADVFFVGFQLLPELLASCVLEEDYEASSVLLRPLEGLCEL